ncbi:hypothetical protein BSG1_19899 [Bacillus sp. SG-1]|nr:hypothetical protein BSG1_19899 [Bacillus sp. SG-1]
MNYSWQDWMDLEGVTKNNNTLISHTNYVLITTLKGESECKYVM